MTRRDTRVQAIDLGIWCLLILHAGLLAHAAVVNSVTFDEFNLLASGVAWLVYGSASIGNITPPLLRVWAAFPALAAGVQAPLVAPFESLAPIERHWAYGEAFLQANYFTYHELFVLARAAMIPLSCLGAWLTAQWARRLYGRQAALAACFLYVMCPNISAYASLMGTDVGMMTLLLSALWCWWWFCRRPDWKRLLAAGFMTALAHLGKFTALTLWAAAAGMVLWTGIMDPRRRWRVRASGIGAALLITVLLVNAAYRFQGTGRPAGSYAFRSQAMRWWQQLPDALPIPLPAEALIGFDAQQAHFETRQVGFALGELYRGTRWYYYPLVLACKLPVSVLCLIVLAVVAAATGPPSRPPNRQGEGLLLAALGCGFLAVMLVPVNVGIRYLLPLFPFGFIWISRLWARAPAGSRLPRWVRTLRALLLMTLVVEHAAIAPRYLTFFNLAAGGPSRGFRLLNDSNFDLGQGLLDLKRWMDAAGVTRIQLAYHTPVDPGVYGIVYEPLIWPGVKSEARLTEPLVVVSSYYLAGMPQRMRTPIGMTDWLRLPFYKSLQAKRPVAVAGSTLFVYRRADVEAAVEESRL